MIAPEALQALGQSINRRTRSMGVALTSCTVPAAGKPSFDIADNEMEMGVGIHGEPDRRRVALGPAKAIVEELCAAILGDLGTVRGEALLFVNGFGATPSMELYLLFGEASKQLAAAGVSVARALVGSYVASIDMAGASIAVTMLDEETKALWDAPMRTAALRWGC